MNTHHHSRRHFLNQLCGTTLAAVVTNGALTQGAGQRKPRALFFPRPGAYEPAIVRREGGEPSVCERLMTEMGRRIGIEVECSNDGRVFDNDLDRFDAFVLFWNFDPMKPNKSGDPPLTSRGKQRLIEAVASGKGLLGIHCAAYSFLSGERGEWQAVTQRDPYVKMLGGELWGCLPKQTCHYRIVSPDFPGFAKLNTPTLTMTDEPYGLKNYADDIHVIAVQETEGLRGEPFQRAAFPCIWARRHERGRVFYVSLGHDEDSWRTEPFQNIVQGGLDWVLGRANADLTPNLKQTAAKIY